MEKRFRFLRFFSVVIKILAWIILIGSFIAPPFIGAVVSAINLAGNANPAPALSVLETGYIWAIVLFFGIVYFFALYAFSEIILVFLSIEENTRKTVGGTAA